MRETLLINTAIKESRVDHGNRTQITGVGSRQRDAKINATDAVLLENGTGTDVECEFCRELRNPSDSQFRRIYGASFPSRVVFHREGTVALPTIGQLFSGSLLVVPTEHVETIAELPPKRRVLFEEAVAELCVRVRRFGHPIVFEHGAQAGTGRSCGIYHAHAHVVPVPDQVLLTDLLTQPFTQAGTLSEAYESLRDSETYLLLRDTTGTVGFVDGEAARSPQCQSQYFRRALVEHFNLTQSWDWRAYRNPEPRLAETIELLRTNVDTFSQPNC